MQNTVQVNKFEELITVSSPTFKSFESAGRKLEIVTFISVPIRDFIKINYPMTPEPEMVAGEFAGDCIDQKPYWKPEDVKLFISFCKKSQGEERFKIFGNEYMITPAKLFEFASFYDEQRFHVIESKHLEHKKLEQENLPQPEEIKKYSDQIINKISFLHQKKSGPVPKIKMFDPLNSEKDRETLFLEIPNFKPEQLDELEASWERIYKITPEAKTKEREIITEIIREIELEQELRRQNVLHKV